MYCKLFASLYQGTLRGKSHEILVFTNLLANADSAGHVDIHFRAIADEVGLSVDEVRAAIVVLESPDVESRSHEHAGARLVRMDGHREWGWKIVNYIKYRSIRSEEDRREQNRIAQDKFRQNSKQPSAIVSNSKPRKPPSAQAEAEAEAEAEAISARTGENPAGGCGNPAGSCGEIPTLDELKAYAAVQAIPESSVKSFHEHHAGNSLWLNQHGILINWKIKLKSWSEKDRQPKPNHANFRTSAPDRNAGTLNANITPEQLAKLKSKVR